MVKIRLSYDQEKDAERVLKALTPIIAGAKVKKSENGRYKKVYIEVKNA